MERQKAGAQTREKLYRSISEVSDRLAIKPHVLRYWETQFPSLRPQKNRAGNRIYKPEDIQLLDRVKELLYDRRFTIEGARRHLLEERRGKTRSPKTTSPTPSDPAARKRNAVLNEVCAELRTLAGRLRNETRPRPPSGR